MRRSAIALTAIFGLAVAALAADGEDAPPAAKAAPAKEAPAKAAAPAVAAKTLFGKAQVPAPLEARSIGFYARGCLAGARALPIDGPAWQVMRLSRNRNWGHPALITLVERLATDAKAFDGWPGLLVGDISQPRGGPMLTGHASHQIGLDADVWLTPMPDRRLSGKEREDLAATSMLAEGSVTSVDPAAWTGRHHALIRRAASYPEVERVFVHPAIKKALCQASATETDRAWLHKVRPIWGHFYHFHIRISCPPGSTGCEAQKAVAPDDGCGKELDDWFALLTRPARPAPPGPPAKPKPPMALEQLPQECRVVLQTGPGGVAAPAPPPAPPAAKAPEKKAAAK